MKILSGIQPSGKLHIGNYFGMIRPALALQEQGDAFLFIADYHALTSIADAEQLRTYSRAIALDLLACGLDPTKTALYRQSDVPEVTELTWLLSVVTPMGLLERCHSYKDKVAKGIAAHHALFAYPVLMAADILSVQADLVPVGKDQKQHLEVARDIAIKFNNAYGEVFKIPEPSILDDVAIIPGVDGQKMSKAYNNTIGIFGPLKEAKKKIMSIVTDSKTVEEPKDSETCTIFALYKLFASEAQVGELAARYKAGGMGYGDAKKELYASFEKTFESYRAKREELLQQKSYVDEVLDQGGAKAKREVQATLKRARHAVGLE